MADRDESRDVGLIWDSRGDTTRGTPSASFPNDVEPWDEVEGCVYNGANEGWTRYVPHSDLEAAEKEIARLRGQLELRDREVAHLTEDLRHIRTSLEAAEQSIRAAVGHTCPF